jgi:hypothetical protein
MGGRQHRRRALAIVASLLWLLGTEALPALHEAHHDDHHTHDATGGVIVDHGTHHHTIRKPAAKHHREQLAIDHPVSGHQAGGVAHHAVAMMQALPPALPPVVQLEERVVSTPIELPLIAIGTQPAARGPPART